MIENINLFIKKKVRIKIGKISGKICSFLHVLKIAGPGSNACFTENVLRKRIHSENMETHEIQDYKFHNMRRCSHGIKFRLRYTRVADTALNTHI